MNILISNDDGIQATGIHTLAAVAAEFGTIQIVAPDGERSAIGHGITLTRPLRARTWSKEGAPFGTAIDGTPADCVKLAASGALGPAPDLILSGINLGPNAGISVLYSGTCAVASEGAISGIPSIAFSLDTFHNPDWQTASAAARHILAAYTSGKIKIPADNFLNVNIPNIPLTDIQGIRATRMGESRFIENYEKRLDPWGTPYFWMTGELKELGDMTGTDLEALRQQHISLSLIGLDLTSRADHSLEADVAALPPLA